MEGSRSERVMRFADMHARARTNNQKSQEFMALELGVSRKTIQNWESGVSSPTFFQSLEWFRVLNENPFPYYLAFVYPDSMKGVKSADEDKKVEAAFESMIRNISINDKRALLYLYYGDHGSSPHSMVQLMLAHLHIPLPSRIAHAFLVSKMYSMNQELGTIVCQDDILPDMEDLNSAILKAQEAVMHNGSGYTNIN